MDLLSLTWWRKVFQKGGRAFGLGCALVFILPIVITGVSSFRHAPGQQEQPLAGTICTVNGTPVTMRDFAWIPQEQLGGTPGQQHAGAIGSAIYYLVNHKVIEQIAKKNNIHATESEVDRAVAKARESKMPANSTDTEWENYLSDRMHASLSEFREYVAGQADVQALLDAYKKKENVTAEEARNQNSEVKLATVFISTGVNPGLAKAKPLSDAEAMAKANELHAKAVAGGDVPAMAKSTSTDPRSKSSATGIADWTAEYQKNGQETPFGALFYGQEFDKAVQKATKAQITDVVKCTGFQTGYAFAKVIDRRLNTPKDFDEKKVIEAIREQRAFKKLDAEIKAAMKVAKVEFPADQIDKKAYFDFAKLQNLRQDMMGPMGIPAENPPSAAEIKTQEDLVETEFEAALKKHPEDTTLTLMVANQLRTKKFTAKPEDQAAIRDRLIGLYESAFKSTEDIPTRFILAELYHDKHDDRATFNQYNMVIKLLKSDPSYDLASRQKEMGIRRQLMSGLKGLPAATVPEATAAATEQEQLLTDLQQKILEDQAKQALEQKNSGANPPVTRSITVPAVPAGGASSAPLPPATGKPAPGKP